MGVGCLCNRNKMSRNGLINILFEEGPAVKEKEKRDLEQYHLDKFVEEGVFIPRGRLKHVRIIKVTPNHNKPLHCNLKRMFVDGCHLNELIPRRQILSQNYKRHEQEGSQSPELKPDRYAATPPMQRSLFQGRLRELLEKEAEEKDSLYSTVQPMRDRDDCISVEQSTAASSFRYIKPRLSIRSRKVGAPEKAEQKEGNGSLSEKKNLFKTCSKPFPPPENILAKAYVVAQHFSTCNQTSKVIHATFSSKICLQIASLTKIMTCLVAMQTCQRNGVDLQKTEVVVGQMETKVEGTTAELQVGEIYTLWQLLHGMMLPSGNDASLALAAHCGGILLKEKERQKEREKEKEKGKEGEEETGSKKNRVKQFVAEMNKKAIQLNMKRTNYSNTHGLASTLNKSCASDQVLLIEYALRQPLFRKIVGCKLFSSWSIGKEGVASKQLQWENTHRLMHTHPNYYTGIKTGTTEAAGPCLASLLRCGNREFIVLVLNSRSSKARYRDTQRLREWLQKKEGMGATAVDQV